MLLVVDQFEELFTLCNDEEARDAFVRQLLALVETPEPRHVVIITMRTDFVDSLARLPALWERWRSARVDVEALDINELRSAIEGPAALVGLRFEEGIVDDLISTILGEACRAAAAAIYAAQALAAAAAQPDYARGLCRSGQPAPGLGAQRRGVLHAPAL